MVGPHTLSHDTSAFIYILVKGPCVARFYVKIYRIYNYYTKLAIIKRKE